MCHKSRLHWHELTDSFSHDPGWVWFSNDHWVPRCPVRPVLKDKVRTGSSCYQCGEQPWIHYACSGRRVHYDSGKLSVTFCYSIHMNGEFFHSDIFKKKDKKRQNIIKQSLWCYTPLIGGYVVTMTIWASSVWSVSVAPHTQLFPCLLRESNAALPDFCLCCLSPARVISL